MAVPPPRSTPTTAPMANPASQPLPRKQYVCGYPCIGLTGVVFVFVLWFLVLFGFLLLRPPYPTMKVASLSVSNLSAAASTGATWKAAFLATRREGAGMCSGRFLFREIEVFIYHHWDTAQPLAVSLAEPVELGCAAGTVIKAKMRMEKPETEVAEDIDRERRSVRAVIVGLGVRMRVTYLYGSWWKKSFGNFQARCDDLRIVFANSTAEGSSGSMVEGGLVTRDDPVTDDKTPAMNLPPCTLTRIRI